MVDQSYTIPDDLIGNPKELPELSLVNYSSSGDVVRNQVLFSQNVLSFLANGEKEIHLEVEPLRFDHHSFALLTSSRCLMTEISSMGEYRSLLFFFSNAELDRFRLKYEPTIPSGIEAQETMLLQYDDYLLHYRKSLEILAKTPKVSLEIKQAKLDELLLYLLDRYPNHLTPILAGTTSGFELEFKKTVENNKFANLRLEEFAFLCHMSVSTFKRHFVKIYGLPPHQWMLQKRMQRAEWLLRENHAPNAIYPLVGYDSYPNFAKAFKQHFELSPRQYQTVNLQD